MFMTFSPTIVARQKQSITVTAQIIQSTKLLQYGQQELTDFLRDQAERNPFIEVLDPGASPVASSAPVQTMPAAPGSGYSTRDLAGARNLPAGPRGNRAADSSYNIEDFVPQQETLQAHLRMQAAMTFKSSHDLAIAYEIVESLEPDGYLRRDLDEIADFLGIEQSALWPVLSGIQGFHPTGIGARDLAECLKLQLLEKGKMSPAMQMLLDNLPALANHEIDVLSRRCRVTPERILQMAAEIRGLDPRPGKQFDVQPTQPALPDVYLRTTDDGGFKIELNTNLLPRLLIDRQYYAEVRLGVKGTSSARYVSDCARSASWLVRNLEKRADTILKVATEVVMQQQDFFKHGIACLKPLNLQDVADAVGLHSSTVCRAIANKFMMTDRGMFEIKFFFANALSAGEGREEHSSESIRLRIRTMVLNETEATVLSDDAIVRALKGAGVDIARRTVAKYREMMNIPSSNVRKRQRHTIETTPVPHWHADCSVLGAITASAL
jgi:RNA polymerase sigma-54 factor